MTKTATMELPYTTTIMHGVNAASAYVECGYSMKGGETYSLPEPIYVIPGHRLVLELTKGGEVTLRRETGVLPEDVEVVLTPARPVTVKAPTPTSDPWPTPIPMRLPCPACHELHIDTAEFATKPHHTHACQNCGNVWRPAIVPTVGVRFLPGFKNDG